MFTPGCPAAQEGGEPALGEVRGALVVYFLTGENPSPPGFPKWSFEMSIGKICGSLGGFVGSSVGWWIGQSGGMMTAFAVSMLGTGLGIWAGRRIADNLTS